MHISINKMSFESKAEDTNIIKCQYINLAQCESLQEDMSENYNFKIQSLSEFMLNRKGVGGL